jgi:flavin-dependent dehydrogenase
MERMSEGTGTKPMVIVGGGKAGGTAAATLRNESFEGAGRAHQPSARRLVSQHKSAAIAKTSSGAPMSATMWR